MTTTPIDNTSITTGFNVDELTEGTLTGKGVFDVLLQTLRLHLDREFTSGRITGTAYATVYSQAITAFLAQAAQYAISKAKLPLELQLLQEQIVLSQKQQDQITAAIRQTDYVTDYQLPSEVANKTKQTEILQYDLTDIKPTEKAQITQQTSNLSSQQEQIVAETSRVLYEVNYRLPEEVTLIKRNQDQVVAQTDKVATDTVVTIKQGHLTDAQTCQVKAETNQINAVVATKLPKEVLQIEAQTALLAYDLSDIKPVEKDNLVSTGLGIVAQTANTEQNTLNLVKQGNLTDSQKVVADKQALSIVAETSQVTYKTNIMMPEELKVLKLNQDQTTAQITKVSVDTILTSKQGNLVDAQVCEVKASANKINTEVATKLPEEIEILKRNQIQLTAQTSEIDYRVSTLLPSQTAQNTAQTAQITYTTSYVLPSQVSLTNAQTDSATAQTSLYEQKTVTELAQATNAPAATSVMGVQNALMEQQKNQIIRDAEQKTAKIMLDSWQTIFTTDQSLPPTGDIALLLNHTNAAKLKMLQGVGAV